MPAADPQTRKIQNLYHVGAYQSAITSAISLPSSNQEIEIAKNCLLFRCYFAQKKFGLVLSEIPSGENIACEYKILKLLAQYYSAPNEDGLRNILDFAKQCQNSFVAASAAELLLNKGMFEEAMKLVYPFAQSDLECSALFIQLLLVYSRVDIAEKQLEKMREIADDSPITHLTEALVNLQKGGEKYQESFYIYQELMETFGTTSKLLNNQSISQLLADKPEEAEKILLDAYQKSHEDSDVLANLVAFSCFTGKPFEAANRYFAELVHVKNEHLFAREVEKHSSLFDMCAAKFS